MDKKPIAAVLGNETSGPIVTLALLDDGDPAVTIYFKDDSTLTIRGLTVEDCQRLREEGVPEVDDIVNSALAINVERGHARLRQAGSPHPDPRVQTWKPASRGAGQRDDYSVIWPHQVSRVTVTRSAGGPGLYVALAAAGWAPAVSGRIDPIRNLGDVSRTSRTSEDLVRGVASSFRSHLRSGSQCDFVRVAS